MLFVLWQVVLYPADCQGSRLIVIGAGCHGFFLKKARAVKECVGLLEKKGFMKVFLESDDDEADVQASEKGTEDAASLTGHCFLPSSRRRGCRTRVRGLQLYSLANRS